MKPGVCSGDIFKLFLLRSWLNPELFLQFYGFHRVTRPFLVVIVSPLCDKTFCSCQQSKVKPILLGYLYHVRCIDQVNLKNGAFTNDTRISCLLVSCIFQEGSILQLCCRTYKEKLTLLHNYLFFFLNYFSKPHNSITKTNQTTATTTNQKRALIIL